MTFDFTSQGRRPTTAQIMSAWKKAGKPAEFFVEYGETSAQFNRLAHCWALDRTRWMDSGNGCRGVDRSALVKALEKHDVDLIAKEAAR